MVRFAFAAVSIVAFGTSGAVRAQESPAADVPAPKDASSPADYMRPTEAGVRLTPGIARAMGRMFAKEALGRQYDLDDEAQKKACDKIARRIMQLAHKCDKDGQRFLEFAFETLIENHGRFTPESGRKWAELSRPMLPAVREFMNKTADDIRPLIPPDKQMQFAGDMMKASLAVDMYEKKMERWSQGKAGEHEDPFDPDSPEPTTASSDANEPAELKEARHRAENSVKWETTGRWRQYVNSTISYYNLDEAQKKSAESMLREMEDRAKQVQTEDWKARMLLNRTRLNLSYRGMHLWSTPWMWQVEREYEDLLEPIRQLTRELQDRLDTLPTEQQRQAAAAKTAEEFAKRGMKG